MLGFADDDSGSFSPAWVDVVVGLFPLPSFAVISFLVGCLSSETVVDFLLLDFFAGFSQASPLDSLLWLDSLLLLLASLATLATTAATLA